LQCDKACGPDCIPAQLLKAGADFISLQAIPTFLGPALAHYQETGSLPILFQFTKKAINTFPPTIVPLALHRLSLK